MPPVTYDRTGRQGKERKRGSMKVVYLVALLLTIGKLRANPIDQSIEALEPFTGNYISQENNCEFSFHKSESHNGAYVLNILSRETSRAVVIGQYLFRSDYKIKTRKNGFRIITEQTYKRIAGPLCEYCPSRKFEDKIVFTQEEDTLSVAYTLVTENKRTTLACKKAVLVE